MSERIRSFIAVNIPPESADRLRAAQGRLQETEARVKWVDPDAFHITLKFLGGVEPERLDALWESVAAALDGRQPFTLHFSGVGTFPGPQRPRVVWAGITGGAEELTDLAAVVEEACAEHGFERERRPFRAHMTLGRVRRPESNPALAVAVAELSDADLGEVRVERTLLMKSELTRAGAIYHVREEKLLG